jgi:hypothetical protein
VTGALWLVDGGVTVGKGPIGMEAERDVKRQPEGELDLQHSHDGMRGKGAAQIKG